MRRPTLPQYVRLPEGTTPFERELVKALHVYLTDIHRFLFSTGTSDTQAPSNTTLSRKSIVWNENYLALGAAGSGYSVLGWINCATEASATDDWREIRCLNGA